MSLTHKVLSDELKCIQKMGSVVFSDSEYYLENFNPWKESGRQ